MSIFQHEIATLKLCFTCVTNAIKILEPLTIETRSKDKPDLKKEKEAQVKAVSELKRAVHGFSSIDRLEKNTNSFWLHITTKLDEIQNSTQSQCAENSVNGEALKRIEDMMKDQSTNSSITEGFERMEKLIKEHPANVSVKGEVKAAVKDSVKGSLKEAMEKVMNTTEMKKTFAEALKESTSAIEKQTKVCFEKSLGSALQENQSAIISQTAAKQEANMVDRDRRTRNIVISSIEESSCKEVKERTESDINVALELLQDHNVSREDIIKCFRPGPPLGTGSNKDRKEPRPLILSLATPEMASRTNYK
eukprot:sb/3467182/